MFYGNKPESAVPRPIKATAWFDRDDAGGLGPGAELQGRG
jgi:hypothetical protein